MHCILFTKKIILNSATYHRCINTRVSTLQTGSCIQICKSFLAFSPDLKKNPFKLLKHSSYLLVDFSESAKNGLFKFPIYSLGKLVNLWTHFRVMALLVHNCYQKNFIAETMGVV